MTCGNSLVVMLALAWISGTLWTIRSQLARIADALERIAKGE